MARPRLGKEKSERFQLVITAEELEAIEDWRFRNRVQTKSEAIRRLCQIGKDMETVIPNAADHADFVLGSTRLMYEFVVRSVEVVKDGGKLDTEELIGRAADLLDRASELQLILMRENNRIIPLAERKGIRLALEAAANSEEEMDRIFDGYRANRDEMSESRLMAKALSEMTGDERAAYRKKDGEQRVMFWMMKLGHMRYEMLQAKLGEDQAS